MNCPAAAAPRRILMSFTSADRTGPDEYLITGSSRATSGVNRQPERRFVLAGDSTQHLHTAP
jgi:hypothetical protein